MACEPYIKFVPGDLITAESMNEMQTLICTDVDTKVAEGVAGLTSVPNAEDADKLEGKTAEELCQEWLEKALQAIPERTGYMQVFKRLKEDDVAIIEHNLKTSPLVDIYQLRPFDVICAIDDDKHRSKVYFFLYHTSEKKIKDPDGNSVEIEQGDLPVQFKIPLADVLERFKVPYTPDSSLGDLETELWKAMFSPPNDDFDMDDYCHSPWFERCCREERTVESLQKKGDWNDLWLKIVPVKTINKPSSRTDLSNDEVYPTDLTVAHFNMNTVGIKNDASSSPDNGDRVSEDQRLMILLKV